MSRRKVQFGTQLPPDLVDQVRAAVLNLQRADPSMSIARFTEQALIRALHDVGSSFGDSAGITAAPFRAGRRIRPAIPLESPDGEQHHG